MDELIKIREDNSGRRLVSGRELHEFLEIKTPYHKWLPRMCEYGFDENKDYIVIDIFVPNSNGGKQSQTDHALTINMAKELSMIQRTDKGKQARQYFIACENKLKEISNNQIPQDYISALKALITKEEEKIALIEENKSLEIELDREKDWYSIKRISAITGTNWKCYNWRKLKQESAKQDIIVKKIFDANYGEVNTYNRSVWLSCYPELTNKF